MKKDELDDGETDDYYQIPNGCLWRQICGRSLARPTNTASLAVASAAFNLAPGAAWRIWTTRQLVPRLFAEPMMDGAELLVTRQSHIVDSSINIFHIPHIGDCSCEETHRHKRLAISGHAERD